ncbi:hypothetical protein [Hydrococcus rivularis]|uniref:hypothetical protein n=1 Tax=Hydrococcus rivularis TaxID=1616834 RepID=UPI000A9704D7|nr:hypothetical protein [Hydrococcus rivularis]
MGSKLKVPTIQITCPMFSLYHLIVDRPHPQPLSQIGRGEKNVDRENLKIGIRRFILSCR